MISKGKPVFIVLLCASLLFFAAAAGAAEPAGISIPAVKATSFVPGEESRFTVIFMVYEQLDLSVGATVYLDFPPDFGIVQNSLENPDPGCTLATIQYKNNPKESFYSVLNGETSVVKEAYATRFYLGPKQPNALINPGTDVYLTVPGVLNGPAKGTHQLTLTVHGANGKSYTQTTQITLGEPPAAAPVGLTLTAPSSSRINAAWEAVYGATRYQLLYSGVPDGVFILACDFGREPQPGEEWALTDTACSYSGTGNGGLEAGRTYYFKVRAGNEFGFGPCSAAVPVTTPAVSPVRLAPGNGESNVSPQHTVTAVLDQAVIVTDDDKIQIYEKATGTPLPKNQLRADKNTVTIASPLKPKTEYQVVFYGGALAAAANPQVINQVFSWTFTTGKESDREGGDGGEDGGSTAPATGTTGPQPVPPAPGQPQPTFRDIKGHWAQKDIELLAARGYWPFPENGLFTPDQAITRAEFTALLVRCLGLAVEADQSCPFTDLPPAAWYRKSIAVAYAAGIAHGTAENQFAPEAPLTREQMAALLANALRYKKIAEIPKTGSLQALSRFPDRNRISPWATPSCTLVVEKGLIRGGDNGCFNPGQAATRAEAAAVLARLLNLFDSFPGGAENAQN